MLGEVLFLHTAVVPLIVAFGNGFTVNGLVTIVIQPLALVTL